MGADSMPGETLGELRALPEEMGVRSPLCEVEPTKEEIKLLSRNLRLSFCDKAPVACLASRIPYGTPATREILEKIDRPEDSLLSLGLRQVRVRHHGEIARIEAEPGDIEEIMRRREEVVGKLKTLGYICTVLDLEGYRSGSLSLMLEGTKGQDSGFLQNRERGIAERKG